MTDGSLQRAEGRWPWLIETAKKAVMRVLFPDFSNKLTWYVVALGAAPILTPESIQFLLIDWFLDTFSLSIGKELTLADFAASNADYWLGFGLIAVALLHNLGNKWITAQDSDHASKERERLRESDLGLFREFLHLLPSSGSSIRLLSEHDFGGTFRSEPLRPIESFIIEWQVPEKRFHDAELESARSIFMQAAKRFDNLICRETGPVGVHCLAVVPDRHRGEWNWPPEVDAAVKSVNDSAAAAFEAHQSLVRLAKVKLGC